MNVIEISAAGKCAPTLALGKRGENLATEIHFDFSAWSEEFGSTGFVELNVKRKGDESAYPVTVTIDGTVAIWTVTATDTDVAGLGEAEFLYRVGETVVKSVVFGTAVEQDIGQPSETPPDPYETWLDTLTDLAADTRESAQRAETAEEAAEAAQRGAEAAQAATEEALAPVVADVNDLKETVDVTIGITLHNLPEGYTEKYAIETPGETWIDTGINWNKTTTTGYPRIVIDVLATGGCAFGSRRTTTRRVEGAPGTDWYYGVSRVTGGETLALLGKRCVCDLSDTRLIIDGEQIGNSYTVGSSVGSGDTIVLFGSRAHEGQAGITDAYAESGTRLYSVKIYKQSSGVEKLVFDGVPCVRETDSAAGFYDIVGDTFHDAVTGEPTAVEFPNIVDVENRTLSLESEVDDKQDALIDVNLSVMDVYGTSSNPYGFVKGYWSPSTGGAQSSSLNSMRTINASPFIASDGDRSLTVTVSTGYKVQINEYTADGTFAASYGRFDTGTVTASCSLTAGNRYNITIGGFDGDSPDYINNDFLSTVIFTVRRTLIAWELEQDSRIAALEATATRGLVDLSDIEDFAEGGVYTQSFTLKLPFDGNNENQIFSCCAKYNQDDGVTSWPTIYFNTSGRDNLNRTCPYILGGNGEYKMQEWRVVRWPGDKTQYSAIVTIPDGVTVTIADFRSRYDDSVNRIDTGIVMYGHQRMPMTPDDTVQSAMLAAKAGHSHFVEIPKRCSDGVWIFYHDDTLKYNDTHIRQADGSLLPSTYNGTLWSNISYADEASKWDWGISTNARFAGTGPMRMETYFEICAKSGMKPALSVHPLPSASELGEIKEMAQRYGVLENLTLKGTPYAITQMWAVFGNSIFAYVIDVPSGYQTAATITSAINTMNGLTGCTVSRVIELFESTAYSAYFNADVSKRHTPFEAIAAAGYKCSIAAQLGAYSPTTSGTNVIIPASDMEWWCNNHGVTQFTTEHNYSVGLNW